MNNFQLNIITICIFLTILLTGCNSTSTSESLPVPAEAKETLEQTNDIVHSETEESKTRNIVHLLSNLQVHFIDVGQADATLLTYTSDGVDYRILIDAGNWDRTDVVDYLNKLEISHLDIMIGTHPHADHIGQMDKILHAVDVSEVWMSGDITTSQTFERVMIGIEESGVGYHEPRAGEVYDIGPLIMEIINPERLTGDFHEGSIALRIQYGNVSFLFTGDAEQQTERAILQRGHVVQADILQLGHHGSQTSTTEHFLQSVNPSVAIYSAGKGNSYGHPHESVISRVLEANINLYGTDIHGTIIVETDGHTFTVWTEKNSNGAVVSSDFEFSTTNSNDSFVTTCIDINTAPIEVLQEIIHIGESRAEELLRLRPFESLEHLSRINGIGPSRVDDIITENLACIGG